MTTGRSMDQRGTRRFVFFSPSLSNEANWIILSIYLCTQQPPPPPTPHPRAFYYSCDIRADEGGGRLCVDSLLLSDAKLLLCAVM